jgi:hypothetical protein
VTGDPMRFRNPRQQSAILLYKENADARIEIFAVRDAFLFCIVYIA